MSRECAIALVPSTFAPASSSSRRQASSRSRWSGRRTRRRSGSRPPRAAARSSAARARRPPRRRARRACRTPGAPSSSPGRRRRRAAPARRRAAVGALAAEERRVARVEQRKPVARAGRPRGEAGVAGERRPHAVGVAEQSAASKLSRARSRVEREQRLGVSRCRSSPPPRAVAPGPRARPAPPRRGARAAASSPRRARGHRELRVGELQLLAALLARRLDASLRLRRARSRSIRPASIPITSRVARGPRAGRRWIGTRHSVTRRGGPGALPADQGAPSCAPRTLPARPRRVKHR